MNYKGYTIEEKYNGNYWFELISNPTKSAGVCQSLEECKAEIDQLIEEENRPNYITVPSKRIKLFKIETRTPSEEEKTK